MASASLAGSKFLWILLSVVWLLVVGDAHAQRDCSHSNLEFIMESSSNCQNPLLSPTNSALEGQLTIDDKPTMCKKYNDTMACLTKLKECKNDASILDDITNDLKMGIGQLCTNQKAFKKYLTFTECYASERSLTSSCVSSFEESVAIAYGMAEPPDDSDEFDDICGSLHTLVNCTGSIILPSCGPGAANVFHNLLLTKIPNLVFSLCPDFRESMTPYTSSDASSCRTHSSLVLALLTVTSLKVSLGLSISRGGF